MKRDYERLPIQTFGQRLLDTGDLDPIYNALHRMELPYTQLCQWLLAYWCLYNAGVASWMSERDPEEFFSTLMVAARNEDHSPAPTGERWPRGAERRHWRGAQAIRSCEDLSTHGSAACLIEEIIQGAHSMPFTTVRDRVLKLRGFGDWIAFKVGDMLDRLGLVKVNFERAEVFMFADPRKAALMYARQQAGLPESARFKDEEEIIRQVVNSLTDLLGHNTAPPDHQRPVGLQEIETVLCKWKSHMNGHYPVGNDIHEITQGLIPWTQVSRTASLMRGCMDREV